VKSPAVPPRLRAALCILALLTVVATGARAQSPVSGIAGTVRDSLGVPLEQVVVEAHDPATGYAARTATNRVGRYILLGLPLGGPYAVRARRVGYVAAERGGVVLTIGARPSVDFVLRAAVPQLSAVAVRAAADAGRDTRIGGSTRIAQAQIDALPTRDRNVAGLAGLSRSPGRTDCGGMAPRSSTRPPRTARSMQPSMYARRARRTIGCSCSRARSFCGACSAMAVMWSAWGAVRSPRSCRTTWGTTNC
jgi:hypothetical protein